MVEILKVVIFLVLYFTLVQCSCDIDPNLPASRRLRAKLLCNYDPSVIPLNPPDEAKIHADLALSLRNIQMDESSGIFKLTAWILVLWNDHSLTWNLTEYGNIQNIVISSDLIWTPGFTLFNSDHSQSNIFKPAVQCSVTNSGYVLCEPSVSAPLYCSVDMTRWPYDSQFCDVKVGSLAYTELHVVLSSSSVNHPVIKWKTFYYENDLWYLKDVNVTHQSTIDCCPNTSFPHLNWRLTIQRNAGFFETLYISPAFLLASLTLLSFWIKALNMRILLCCTSLTANILILISLAQEIKGAGNSTPHIVVAYRDSIFLTLVTLAFSIIRTALGACESPQLLVRFAGFLRNRGGRAGMMLLGPPDESTDNYPAAVPVELLEGAVEQGSPPPKPSCAKFATLLDRTAFVVLFIIYTSILIALLP